jgi:hypothetical protein
MHYNPNATGVQSIRRLRIFDSQGLLLSDQSFAPGALPVLGRGSRLVATFSSATFQGLTFLVNWSQTVDAAAAIPKLDLFTFDAANFTLAGQSNCP